MSTCIVISFHICTFNYAALLRLLLNTQQKEIYYVPPRNTKYIFHETFYCWKHFEEMGGGRRRKGRKINNNVNRDELDVWRIQSGWIQSIHASNFIRWKIGFYESRYVWKGYFFWLITEMHNTRRSTIAQRLHGLLEFLRSKKFFL